MRQNKGLIKFFNTLVQSWNTIFFALLMFGGFYLLTLQYYIAGPITIVIGMGGAYYCLKQAQAWSEIKKEEIPDVEKKKMF